MIRMTCLLAQDRRCGEQTLLTGLWCAASHGMYHRGQLATGARSATCRRSRSLFQDGRGAIETLFELIVSFVFEVVGQLSFELLTGLGWDELRPERRRGRPAWLAAFLHMAMGACAGLVSLLILRERLTASGPSPASASC